MGLKITNIIPLKYSYIGCLVKTKLWFFNFHTRRQVVNGENLFKIAQVIYSYSKFLGGKSYILRIFWGGASSLESPELFTKRGSAQVGEEGCG